MTQDTTSSISPREQEWLNTKQAAQFLGLSKSILDKARHFGELGGRPGPRYVKVGKKLVRYHIDVLREWFMEGERGAVRDAQRHAH